MRFNYNKLKGRVKEVLGNQEAYAEALGISRTSLSLRFTGKQEFTQDEIMNSCEILKFDPKEIPSYFFKTNV